MFGLSQLGLGQISPDRTTLLDQDIPEASGIAKRNDTLWIINDGGSPPQLFLYGLKGDFLGSVALSGVGNVDWEAISWQGDSVLWIADFGNNANSRKNLKFYSVRNLNLENASFDLDSLTFTYTNQSAFPPQISDLHFDAEAFVLKNDSILIFTKNRSNPYNGFCYVHYLPAENGDFKTFLLDSVFTGQGPKELNWITDASYAMDELWLLSHGYVLRFSNFTSARFSSPDKLIFDAFSQKEGVAYFSPILYVVDEVNYIFPGGNLYEYKVEFSSSIPRSTYNQLGIKLNNCKISLTDKTKSATFYNLKGQKIASLNHEVKSLFLPNLPKLMIVQYQQNNAYINQKIHNPCLK